MAKSKRASAPASKSIDDLTPTPRCRKGDLAILLEGPYSGHIVDVVEYYGTVTIDSGEVLVNAWHIQHSSDEPGWQFFKEDGYLLPIRPGDLDETEIDELSLVHGRSA